MPARMSAADCRAEAETRRQFAGPGSEPGVDQVARHLDVELHSDVAIVDDERLVGSECTGGDTHRSAFGHGERIVVPLERRERRAPAEPFATRRSVAHGHVDPALLGVLAHAPPARRAPWRAAARRGNARAPEPLRATASRNNAVSGVDPRQLVVDAHRAAHHRDAGVRARIGWNRRAFVDGDELPGKRAPVEPLREVARTLGRRETEDGDGKHVATCARITRSYQCVATPRTGALHRAPARQQDRGSEPAGDPRVRGMIVDRLEVLRLDGESVDARIASRGAPRRRAPCPRRSGDCCTRTR